MLYTRVVCVWLAAILAAYLVKYVGTKGAELVQEGLVIAGWQAQNATYVGIASGIILAVITATLIVCTVVKDIRREGGILIPE